MRPCGPSGWIGIAVAGALGILGEASRAAEITVFAAVSLTDVLQPLATAHAARTGDRVAFNWGSSSQLARQILEGAPADLFLSADVAQMDGLEKAGRIRPGTRRSRLSNTLALVAAVDLPGELRTARDLTNAWVRRVALADPGAVPAGVYAKAYLQGQRLWPALQAKVVPLDNVRAALAAVAEGHADAGFVYLSDARSSSRVRLAQSIPASEGPRIEYPMAVLQGSRQPEAAQRFLDHVLSEAARPAFEGRGFRFLPAEATREGTSEVAP